VEVNSVSGALHLISSDGAIKIHNATGTLDTRSSDGQVNIDGRFSALQVHTSDGSLDLAIAEGSKLSSGSRIESSDGSVKLRLPRSLGANLEVHTSDGRIHCDLPLSMDGYISGKDSEHTLRGRLNQGGATLAIRTSDGSVSIMPL
jgi:DUF4097 and DUF4098 domain-containing protein YvlB